jgi:hypothetical protein
MLTNAPQTIVVVPAEKLIVAVFPLPSESPIIPEGAAAVPVNVDAPDMVVVVFTGIPIVVPDPMVIEANVLAPVMLTMPRLVLLLTVNAPKVFPALKKNRVLDVVAVNAMVAF